MLFSRRAITASLMTMGIMSRLSASPQSDSRLRAVTFRDGQVAGIEQDGIVSFKGIPFAAPPVDALRFLPPKPVTPWRHVRDGSKFGFASIQSPPRWPVPIDVYLGAMPGEDCLHLNIWAPAKPGPHPVYVYVHGGANQSGAASQAFFDGSHFAASGIVCVTVGYRVGILGFLELGKLLGPDYAGSGNNGLRDIVAALEWVRGNIAVVGGDPNRVTLGGQSAGAKNVYSLLACPHARGLFQSAIMESGGNTYFTMEEAENVGGLASKALRESGRQPTDLLTMQPAEILKIQEAVIRDFPRMFAFRGVTGGDFLPVPSLDAITAGAADGIRLLLGSNRDESIMFVDRAKAAEPIDSRALAHMDLETAKPIFERYRRAYPDMSPLALKVKFLSAEEYIQPTIRLAQAHAARNKAPTYLYHFAHKVSSGPFAGWASHSLQGGYVWDILDTPAWRGLGGVPQPADFSLAKEMNQRWVNFIAGKAPNAEQKPAWPRFRSSTKYMLYFEMRGEVRRLDPVEQKIW